MFALTIRQPYASLIIKGVKKLETRSWKPDFYGPIIIHAANAIPEQHLEDVLAEHNMRPSLELPRGRILGLAKINQVFKCKDFEEDGDLARMVTPTERRMGNFAPNNYAWWILKTKEFHQLLKCPGQPGLWIPGPTLANRISELCVKVAI